MILARSLPFGRERWRQLDLFDNSQGLQMPFQKKTRDLGQQARRQAFFSLGKELYDSRGKISLAGALGVSQPLVSLMNRGKTPIADEMVHRFAAVLRADVIALRRRAAEIEIIAARIEGEV